MYATQFIMWPYWQPLLIPIDSWEMSLHCIHYFLWVTLQTGLKCIYTLYDCVLSHAQTSEQLQMCRRSIVKFHKLIINGISLWNYFYIHVGKCSHTKVSACNQTHLHLLLHIPKKIPEIQLFEKQTLQSGCSNILRAMRMEMLVMYIIR